MTALTKSKQVLKTKIVKSGPYADKAWNRIQIIQEKIKKGDPFKIGAGGTGPNVYGVSFDSISDKFTYVINKNGTGKSITVTRNKIFKDNDLGGGGGSRGGAEVTAFAESMQCYYNAYYFQKGLQAKPPTPKELTSAGVKSKCFTTESAENCLKSALITKWFEDEVFIKIAKTLTKRYKPSFGTTTTFHRGSSFMNAVYKAKKVTHKNDKDSATVDSPTQAPGSFGDDKWNPGDIWISAENQFPTKTDLPSVKKMNAYLLKKYISADIMGISLKKLGKNPTFDTYNLPNQKISFVFNKIVTPKTGTNSKDMYVEAGKNVGDMRIQIRTFDVTGKDNIQCEIKGKNAAGGKAGFGVTSYLIKQLAGVTIKDKDQINRLTEDQKIKEIANGYTKAGFPQYTSAKLKMELTTKEFVDKTTKKFRQEIKDDFFISKIQSTQIAGALNTLAKKGKPFFQD